MLIVKSFNLKQFDYVTDCTETLSFETLKTFKLKVSETPDE